MKGKSLLFLVVITFAVLTYVYYGIQKPAEEKQSGGGAEDKIAVGKMEQLQWITVKTTAGLFRLERQDIGWKMTEPTSDIASQSKVEALIAAIERLKKIKVLYTQNELEKNQTNLMQFGLAPSRIRIEYKTGDLSEPFAFELGQTNPSNSGSFLLQQKLGLLLVNMDLDYLGTQSSKDFQEMRLTTVAESDIQDISMTRGSIKLHLEKENPSGTWKMTSPWKYPLDQDAVRGFVEKVSFIRANEFLSSPPKALNNPEIRIVLGFKEGSKDLRSNENDQRPQGAEILLARESTKSKGKGDSFNFYAKSDKTKAAAIVQYHYDNFLKNPEDLVKRSFDHFLTGDIESATIQVEKKPSLTISANGSDFETQMDNQKIQLDKEKVEKIFQQIRNLKASRFIASSKALPQKSALEVTIRLKGRASEVFSFVKDQQKKDKDKLFYKNSDWILEYEIPTNAVDSSLFAIDSLKRTSEAHSVQAK